jgi:acetoin utilization deacetylase AcuC-like enzyme
MQGTGSTSPQSPQNQQEQHSEADASTQPVQEGQEVSNSAQGSGGAQDDVDMDAMDALLGGLQSERVSSRYIHDCPINQATFEAACVAAGSAVDVAVAVATGQPWFNLGIHHGMH